MWLISIVNICNIDIIFNYVDNILIEVVLINRLNLHAPFTNGIRARQLFHDGEVDEILNFFDYNILLSASFNLIDNETVILEQVFTDLDEDDVFNNYISDEDFSFDRYEITDSDYVYDDTDWNYNSS